MTVEYIILFTVIAVLLAVIFSELYPAIDAKCYTKYESRLLTPFWFWLFKEYDINFHWWFIHLQYANAVPRYRVFQKMIIVCYWLPAYIFFYSMFPWYIVLLSGFGVAWAYYWMKYEYRYYYWAEQLDSLGSLEMNNADVYWLKRLYFAGKWLFKDRFAVWKFELSYLVGSVGLYFFTVAGFVIYYFLN